jgi:hypothetical protein
VSQPGTDLGPSAKFELVNFDRLKACLQWGSGARSMKSNYNLRHCIIIERLATLWRQTVTVASFYVQQDQIGELMALKVRLCVLHWHEKLFICPVVKNVFSTGKSCSMTTP